MFVTPHIRDAPSFVLPPKFTEDYEKASIDRMKGFLGKLQKWVAAHGDQQDAGMMKQLTLRLSSILGRKKQGKPNSMDEQIASELAGYLEKSYVTLAEFMGTFRRHVHILNQTMKGPYFMVVHATHERGNAEMPLLPKSSAWLAQSVTQIMGHKHALQGMLRVVNNRIKVTNDADKWPVGSDRNVIYVDDGVYSGQQLMSFVISFAAFLWKNAKAHGTGGTGKTHMWIVIPYRTKRGQHVLDVLASGSFINNLQDKLGEFMTDEYPELMDAIAQGAKAKDIANIAKRYLRIHIVERQNYSSITDTSEVFDKLGIKYNGMGAGLTIFEHKVPDAVSFPNALAKGALIKGGKLTLPRDNSARVPFVSQTDEKPYSKNRPGMMRHIIGSTNNMEIPYGLGHAKGRD